MKATGTASFEILKKKREAITALGSADAREGITAFLEKRAPKFS